MPLQQWFSKQFKLFDTFMYLFTKRLKYYDNFDQENKQKEQQIETYKERI